MCCSYGKEAGIKGLGELTLNILEFAFKYSQKLFYFTVLIKALFLLHLFLFFGFVYNSNAVIIMELLL